MRGRTRERTLGAVETRDDRDLARLPEVYAAALRLRAGGASDEDLAAALGIDVAGVETLLELAGAKLATLRKDETS